MPSQSIRVVRMVDWDTPVPLDGEAVAWLESLGVAYRICEFAKLLEHCRWQSAEIQRLHTLLEERPMTWALSASGDKAQAKQMLAQSRERALSGAQSAAEYEVVDSQARILDRLIDAAADLASVSISYSGHTGDATRGPAQFGAYMTGSCSIVAPRTLAAGGALPADHSKPSVEQTRERVAEERQSADPNDR